MASSTESSGAVPMRIAVRDGPAWRTADTNATCERPGTNTPTAKKAARSAGSAPFRASSASAPATAKAVPAITGTPATGSPPRIETPADGDRHRTEERAREQAEQDGVHQ